MDMSTPRELPVTPPAGQVIDPVCGMTVDLERRSRRRGSRSCTRAPSTASAGVAAASTSRRTPARYLAPDHIPSM